MFIFSVWQPACLEVFRAVYQACIFCCVEEGLESSYLRLWLLGFLRNNRRNTARYFPFLCRVTLATATFICKLWGLEKNMKSQKGPLSSPLPLLPPPPSQPAPSHFLPPNPPFISKMQCRATRQLYVLWFTAESEQMQMLTPPPQSGARCLHSPHWRVSWPAVTRSRETPVFLEPHPPAFPNKIHLHTWGGRGEPEMRAVLALSVPTDMSKCPLKYLMCHKFFGFFNKRGRKRLKRGWKWEFCVWEVPHVWSDSPPLIKTGSEASCLPGSSCYPPSSGAFPPTAQTLNTMNPLGAVSSDGAQLNRISLVFLCLCLNKKTIYLHGPVAWQQTFARKNVHT